MENCEDDFILEHEVKILQTNKNNCIRIVLKFLIIASTIDGLKISFSSSSITVKQWLNAI